MSVVDRMCGALCDAMLGTSRSASRLSSLARTNLFLVPLDAEAKWFRFHPLFRDMLQGELARRCPDRKIALLGRAIDWYEAHDDLDAAIGCAIAAGDLDRLAPLCARGVLPAYWNGRSATIERWFAAVDEPALLAGHGSLAALGAAMLALWGRAEASDRWASPSPP